MKRNGGGWDSIAGWELKSQDKLLTSLHEPVLLPHTLQANETFAFVGNVTHYAQVWLNISAEIRSFLEQGRLQRHLDWLQQV